MDEKMDRGALALHLAYRLTLKAFPMGDAEETSWTSDGSPVTDASESKFWRHTDMNNEAEVKARLQEMAEFIGGLASRLEGR